MNRTRRRRGYIFLGLASILLFTGAMGAIVLDRSLESYRSAAGLEHRLAARAAAESAAVVLAETKALPAGFEIGNCRVSEAGNQLNVTVNSRKGKPLFQQSFTLVLDRKESGPWQIVALHTASR